MLRDKRRNVVNFIHPEKKRLSLLQTTTTSSSPYLFFFFSFLPLPSSKTQQSWDIVTSVTSLLGGGREREREEGERERVPRRGGCQQCNEWRSILSLGQARAFTPRCSPGDTEPRVVARGITGGVLTLGRGGGRGWVAHGTLPSADRGATYASHPFVRNDDGVHPSWASSFSDGLDPIPLAN